MSPNLDLGRTRLILAECAAHGLLRNQAAYVLATAYHETAHTMQPVMETLATDASTAVARLDRAFAKGQLKWVRTPYWRRDAEGKSWLGRGFVQLTHRVNYQRASDKLGLDLTTDPDAVMEPGTAALILVRGMVEGWFTGKRLADYITLARSSFVSARRIINGTDKASEIAAIARAYDVALKAEGYGEARPAPVVPPLIGPADLWRRLHDDPAHPSQAEWSAWRASAFGAPVDTDPH